MVTREAFLQDFARRLNEALDDLGVVIGEGRQAQVARMFNVKPPAARKWLLGEGLPEVTKIPGMATKLDVNFSWLLYGIGPKKGPPHQQAVDTEPYVTPVAEAPPLGPLSSVPVVGTTQGGAPDTIWLEEGYPVGYSDDVLDVPAKDRNAYALRVVGNSMSPRMREGDYIMIYPNQEAQPGDEVVVRTNKGEVMVKQLAYIRAGEVALDSIAKDHDRIVRKLEEIVYIHFVAGIHPAGALRKQT